MANEKSKQDAAKSEEVMVVGCGRNGLSLSTGGKELMQQRCLQSHEGMKGFKELRGGAPAVAKQIRERYCSKKEDEVHLRHRLWGARTHGEADNGRIVVFCTRFGCMAVSKKTRIRQEVPWAT